MKARKYTFIFLYFLNTLFVFYDYFPLKHVIIHFYGFDFMCMFKEFTSEKHNLRQKGGKCKSLQY